MCVRNVLVQCVRESIGPHARWQRPSTTKTSTADSCATSPAGVSLLLSLSTFITTAVIFYYFTVSKSKVI